MNKAEYSRARRERIKAELAAAGVDRKTATAIARGHAPEGTPTLRAIREHQEKGGSVSHLIERSQRETAVAKAVRVDRGSVFSYGTGTVIETGDPDVVARAVDYAAEHDREVTIFGVRDDGTRVPINRGHATPAADLQVAWSGWAYDYDDFFDVLDADSDGYGTGNITTAIVTIL